MSKFAPIFIASSLMMTSPLIFASINPSDLIKVDGQSKARCVEYYSYKGEPYCSTKPLDTKPVDPAIKEYETQNIVFDGRPWQAAWGKKTPQLVTVEYVPMGEDINNWNELVTSQFFPGLQNKTTPKDFADLVIKSMKDGGYKPTVIFFKIQPDMTFFEFKIDEPESQAQDELQVIRKGKDGFYVLHYVIRNSDMGTINRRLWVENLLNSSIKSP